MVVLNIPILPRVADLNWVEVYYSAPMFFDTTLYFALFLAITWYALRQSLPLAAARGVAVVVSVCLTAGMLYANHRLDESLPLFGKVAVFILGIFMALVAVRFLWTLV